MSLGTRPRTDFIISTENFATFPRTLNVRHDDRFSDSGIRTCSRHTPADNTRLRTHVYICISISRRYSIMCNACVYIIYISGPFSDENALFMRLPRPFGSRLKLNVVRLARSPYPCIPNDLCLKTFHPADTFPSHAHANNNIKYTTPSTAAARVWCSSYYNILLYRLL